MGTYDQTIKMYRPIYSNSALYPVYKALFY